MIRHGRTVSRGLRCILLAAVQTSLAGGSALAQSPVTEAPATEAPATETPLARPPSAALPAGVSAYAATRSQCFARGERQAYNAWLDTQRVALPDCVRGVIPPQHTVQSAPVYKPGSNRVVDCASTRANDFGTGYLDVFLADLVQAMDGPEAAPACAAAMVKLWADAAAMTEVTGTGRAARQSAMDRTWTLAGISAAYFTHPAVQEVAKAAVLPDGRTQDAVILDWFAALARQVSAEIDVRRDTRPENNLQYWSAFSLLPTALLTGDAALLGQADGVFVRAVKSVTKDDDPLGPGFLPEELTRGDKSMNYQTFAAFPLVGMAVMSRAYGCDMLDKDWKRDRLVSLVARSVAGREDAQIFVDAVAAREGKPVPQQPRGMSRRAGDLVYLMQRINPAFAARIAAAAAAELGRPEPILAADSGAEAGFDRLGGAFAALADTAAALRDLPPPAALAQSCTSG